MADYCTLCNKKVVTETVDTSSDTIAELTCEEDGKVIYTGLLDDLFNYEFGELPYRSVNMVFESIEKKDYQKSATVNYPCNYEFTRITEFKKIHYADVPNTTILKEYPQEYKRGINTPYYPIFTEDNQAMYKKYADKAAEYKRQMHELEIARQRGEVSDEKYYNTLIDLTTSNNS